LTQIWQNYERQWNLFHRLDLHSILERLYSIVLACPYYRHRGSTEALTVFSQVHILDQTIVFLDRVIRNTTIDQQLLVLLFLPFAMKSSQIDLVVFFQFSKSGCSGSLLYRPSPFTISSTRNINTIIIKRPMYHRDFNNNTKTRHDDNNKSGHRGKERVIIKESRWRKTIRYWPIVLIFHFFNLHIIWLEILFI